MKPVAFLLTMVLLWGLAWGSPPAVQAADAVGHFSTVEGRVEVLRGGKLPAITVKAQDSVMKGDVIRTKCLSKAQVTFMDNSTVTISPESRLAVDEYTFDPAQGKRNAVLQLFQGVALTVVTKFFKVEQPDFVVKTHTAVMGIRGTEVGIRLQPNSSTFLDFTGRACINSNYNEVQGEVCLKPMEATVVERGLPPTLPFAITAEDRNMFMRQISTGVLGRNSTTTCQVAASTIGTTTATTPAGTSQVTPVSTVVDTSGNIVDNPVGPLFVPPQPAPPPEPPVSQFSFDQTYTTTYQLVSLSPFAVATYTNTDPGNGVRTGVYPANFSANFAITATSPQVNTFSSFNTGTFSATSTANVSGVTGGTLSGTMNMIANTSGGTTFSLSGPVSLQPNGNLNFQTNGTFNIGALTGTTTGTWTQVNK